MLSVQSVSDDVDRGDTSDYNHYNHWATHSKVEFRFFQTYFTQPQTKPSHFRGGDTNYVSTETVFDGVENQILKIFAEKRVVK